jgi:hypothetical protein
VNSSSIFQSRRACDLHCRTNSFAMGRISTVFAGADGSTRQLGGRRTALAYLSLQRLATWPVTDERSVHNTKDRDRSFWPWEHVPGANIMQCYSLHDSRFWPHDVSCHIHSTPEPVSFTHRPLPGSCGMDQGSCGAPCLSAYLIASHCY